MLKSFAQNCVTLLLSALLLTACGGGGGGGSGGGETTSGGSAAPSAPGSSGSGGSNTASGSGDPAPATPGETPAKPAGGSTKSHSVQLSWTAPSTREDSSPLTLGEISGYEIYYFLDGSSPEDGSTQTVSGGSTTSTKLTVPATGTYFFAIAAVDQAGLVSDLSNYVSVTIN